MKVTKQGELPIQHENPHGLNERYKIQKIVPNPRFKEGQLDRFRYTLVDVDKESEYFVLRLDDKASDPKHLAACRVAIHAYAEAIKDHLPLLADDLISRYPLL